MRFVGWAYLPNEYIQGWGRSVGRTGPANIYKGVGLVGWKQELHAGKMLKQVQHDIIYCRPEFISGPYRCRMPHKTCHLLLFGLVGWARLHNLFF